MEPVGEGLDICNFNLVINTINTIIRSTVPTNPLLLSIGLNTVVSVTVQVVLNT